MGILSKLASFLPSSPTDFKFDARAFFDHCRAGLLGPTLQQSEVNGCNTILTVMDGLPASYCAYALATAYHETAHTMQPVKEYGGPRYYFRMYDPQGSRPALARKNGNMNPGDGVKFCGRGYVQLTWRNNYAKFGQLIGQPLEANPDLAMKPDIAAKIMRIGMERGLFTGKGFKDYLPETGKADRPQFTNARRIINGLDKASLIAGYALEFQEALWEGDW